jgi:hypothetical protein
MKLIKLNHEKKKSKKKKKKNYIRNDQKEFSISSRWNFGRTRSLGERGDLQ